MKRFLIFLWLAIGLCCFCTGCGQQTSPEDTALQVTVLVKPGVEPSASSSSEASSDSDSSSSASSEEPDENTFVDEAGETTLSPENALLTPAILSLPSASRRR